MRTATDIAIVVGGIIGTLLVLVLIGFGLGAAGIGPLAPIALLLMLIFGWMVSAFIRYRHVRQDELFQVIVTAVEADLPLAPALRAYLSDRPNEGDLGGWDIALLILFPPGFWLWLQRHRYDYRIADVAELLDEGMSLSGALRTVRGVAAREVRIAAWVGETTGKLRECLRRADRERVAGTWIEVAPRLIYPFLLLLFVTGITTFLDIAIMPKMKKIFDDFGHPLPKLTRQLIAISQQVSDYWWTILPFIFLGVPLTIVALVSPDVRWFVPVLGRLYRWETQGLVLRLLAVLIEVGRPIPIALEWLANAGDFPAVVRWRLNSARKIVERGEPLATALHRTGLLPRNMVPLVQTAERINRLPWALNELGDLRSGRAARLVRRFSQVVSPILVIAIGLVVAFIIISTFMPLIDILTRLSE